MSNNILLISELAKQKTNTTNCDTSKDEYYLDGVRVNADLYQFGIELRATRGFRDCKFGAMTASGITRSEVFVYFPDELYCRGVIGYGDIGVNEVIVKYFVNSRHIRNGKIAAWRDKHSVLSSANLKKAIGHAKTYLREFTMPDIYRISKSEVGDAMDKVKDESYQAKRKLSEAIEAGLKDTGFLTLEFRHMVASGYQFQDAEFKERVVNYLQSIDDHNAVLGRKVKVSMVVVYPQLHEQHDAKVTVYTSDTPIDFNKCWIATTMDSAMQQSAVTHTYTRSTVPEDIKGAVQSLSIVEVNQYVDGLGYRTSNNIFYIVQDV